jgi:arylsulfatase
LRAGGVEFTHAVTPIPRTTQALASLLSGAYPRTTTVRDLVDPLPPQITSLAELLRARGYATVAVVSNHILTPDRKLDRGFDVYDFADDAREAAATTDAALARLERYRPADALFVWVHYIDPHVPYYPPPELAARFDPGYQGRYASHFGAQKGGIGARAYPEDLGKVNAVFRNDLPPEVRAHVRRLYAADIRNADDHIGRLVDAMKGRLGNDWLIVFTADHGESLGENDYYYDHGDYVSNGEIRVPLSFTLAPGDPLRGHRKIDDWVSLIDIMPTLAELLDLPVGPAVEGRSLVPYLKGQSLPERAVFAECGEAFHPNLVKRRTRFDVSGRLRAVILNDLKLVWAPGQKGEDEYDLFDVKADPGEAVDLYGAEAGRAEPLKRLLHAWADGGPGRASVLSAPDRERLRALGYLE